MSSPRPTPRKTLADMPVEPLKANLIIEIKKAIAAETCRKFAKEDLKLNQQQVRGFELYHGSDDSNLVGSCAKFMGGLDMFSNIWEPEDTEFGSVKMIPQRLHRQPHLQVAHKLNIHEDMLHRTYMKSAVYMSGRTIVNYAKSVLKEARKMLSIVDEAVKARILKRLDGELEYDSGKTEKDFIDFLLFRMFNWKHYNGPTGGGDPSDAVEKPDDTASPAPDGENEENEEGGGGNCLFDSSEEGANEDGLPYPPHNFLPEGFIFFMTRGPLADPEFRIDFEGMENYLENKGRAEARKDAAKQKAKKRDFELGAGEGGVQQRGLALGATNQKDVAIVAQQQARLDHQVHEAEILKLNMVLQSMTDQLKSTMDMAKLYQSLGNAERTAATMASAQQLMDEMAKTRKLLAEKKAGNSSAAVVDLYLSKGGAAMGIESEASSKKQKSD